MGLTDKIGIAILCAFVLFSVVRLFAAPLKLAAKVLLNTALGFLALFLLGLPEPVVLGFYQAILPSIQNVFQALWVFNVPFTLVKGLICVAIAMPVYKPLTPFLKGRRDASK